MDSARPSTYHEAIEQYQAQYKSAIESGTKSPFILPHALFGYVLLFIYLLIFPARFPASRLLRYGIFSIIVWHSLSTMRHARTLGLNYGLGVGLCSSWCILWSATFLVFTDPHKHLLRIKRSSVNPVSVRLNNNDSITCTSTSSTKNTIIDGEARRAPLWWENMPSGFWQRLDWIFDLLTTLRGLHWSWKVSEKHEIIALCQSPSRRTLWSSLSSLLLFSFCLDIIKVLMMTDPYYWGLAGYPSLQRFSMPLFDRVLLNVYRSVLSFAAIYTAVIWIYSLVPLICVHLLGPDLIGVRGEEWMYPPVNGSLSEILQGGLQGFWGKWWHQLLRLPFDAAGSWTINHIKVDKRSTLAWFLRLVVAFTMSGFVHACGAYTLWPDTRSWRPFLFFFIQPIGIGCQNLFSYLQEKYSLFTHFSRTSRCAANLMFTLIWLWMTFPLLADEYARGGLFLAEPLPVSPLRALGVISSERVWWRWQGQWGKWHTGDTWWQSGYAIL